MFGPNAKRVFIETPVVVRRNTIDVPTNNLRCLKETPMVFGEHTSDERTVSGVSTKRHWRKT